jgi:hypothetical protein
MVAFTLVVPGVVDTSHVSPAPEAAAMVRKRNYLPVAAAFVSR